MKVRASIKKICRNCKTIRRNRVIRVICKDQFGIKTTRLIDTDKLLLLEQEFNKSGGSLITLLLEQSDEMKVQLVNKSGQFIN